MSVDARTNARERLLTELREHALLIGSFVLTSGRTAPYLVDAKRAILRPAGFHALAELIAEQARAWEAAAVGGMTMGADPIACAALAGGAEVKAFFVRKEVKGHGLSRRIEGPPLEAVRQEGHEICGVVAICDRLAGGAEAIERAAGAPFVSLTTIDEVYPERPDRA